MTKEPMMAKDFFQKYNYMDAFMNNLKKEKEGFKKEIMLIYNLEEEEFRNYKRSFLLKLKFQLVSNPSYYGAANENADFRESKEFFWRAEK